MNAELEGVPKPKPQGIQMPDLSNADQADATSDIAAPMIPEGGKDIDKPVFTGDLPVPGEDANRPTSTLSHGDAQPSVGVDGLRLRENAAPLGAELYGRAEYTQEDREAEYARTKVNLAVSLNRLRGTDYEAVLQEIKNAQPDAIVGEQFDEESKKNIMRAVRAIKILTDVSPKQWDEALAVTAQKHVVAIENGERAMGDLRLDEKLVSALHDFTEVVRWLARTEYPESYREQKSGM